MARTTIKTCKSGEVLSMDLAHGCAFYLGDKYLGRDGPVSLHAPRADGMTHWVGSLGQASCRVGVSADQAAMISAAIEAARVEWVAASERADAERRAALKAAAEAGDVEAGTALITSDALRAVRYDSRLAKAQTGRDHLDEGE